MPALLRRFNHRPITFSPITAMLKNGKQCTIRQASSRDAEQLLNMIKSCARTSKHLLSTENDFNFSVKAEAKWIESFDGQSSILLVAQVGQTIVGDMELTRGCYSKNYHTASLGITIVEEWRGIGLGTQMFNAILEWAKSKHIETLWLQVFGDNEKAIALYKKMGFEISGTQKSFFKQPSGEYADNITMTLYLNKQ